MTTMTDDSIALRELLGKSTDADLLRRPSVLTATAMVTATAL